MMRRTVALVLGISLTLVSTRAGVAEAAVGAWTSNGPADGIMAVAINPNDEETLLAAGGSGVWQSTDAGASWARVSATLLGRSLAYDPLNASVVFATSADNLRVLKSTDGGATWATSFSSSGKGRINSVRPDPNVAGRVFASGSDSAGLVQVFRSVDAGVTWAGVLPEDLNGAGSPGVPLAGPLATLPGTADLILSGVTYYHSGGVLGSSDGGSSWSRLYNGDFSPLAGATTLAVGAAIYGGLSIEAAGFLVRTDDGGATWTNLTPNLPITGPRFGGAVSAIALDLSQPNVVYIAESDSASPPNTGVFVSGDRGETWSELHHLEPAVPGPDGLALAVAGQTLYAATFGGVYDYTFGTAPLKPPKS
ncbi:MAG: hypothetical protein LC797_03305 [Chloroflexi bacterium]|nr:hypothetical protein [Chloroflexota bacterium]